MSGISRATSLMICTSDDVYSVTGDGFRHSFHDVFNLFGLEWDTSIIENIADSRVRHVWYDKNFAAVAGRLQISRIYQRSCEGTIRRKERVLIQTLHRDNCYVICGTGAKHLLDTTHQFVQRHLLEIVHHHLHHALVVFVQRFRRSVVFLPRQSESIHASHDG